MYKLRQTWNEIMPNKKLYALDIRVQKIDPAWPITAKAEETPVASIHVNPKFLMKVTFDKSIRSCGTAGKASCYFQPGRISI